MHLTADQTDALTELLNIGHGRAATALSEMTGRRIILAVPSVSLVPLPEVNRPLGEFLTERVLCINQAFAGALSGNAMLLIDERASRVLSTMLEGDAEGPMSIAASNEALTEMGNVLLNACLGAFGNLLQIQIAFTVPKLAVDSLPSVLRSIAVGGEALTHAVVAKTKFSLENSEVAGVLMIVVGLTSLECVLRGLDGWDWQ